MYKKVAHEIEWLAMHICYNWYRCATWEQKKRKKKDIDIDKYCE